MAISCDSRRMTPITEVEGRRLALTNLDKVLYPATGFTKGEVLRHPPLRSRNPCWRTSTTGRSPSSATPTGRTDRFFTKNVPPGTPDWSGTAEVPGRRAPPGWCWSRTSPR